MANSADPDQKPTDLDLHCLQRQGISGVSDSAGLELIYCHMSLFIVTLQYHHQVRKTLYIALKGEKEREKKKW